MVALQQKLNATRQAMPEDIAQPRELPEVSEAQIAPVKRELARVQLELAEAHASHSWRVTRPLRAAGRLQPRLLRGGRSSGPSDAA
jgi:hypothetical protein